MAEPGELTDRERGIIAELQPDVRWMFEGLINYARGLGFQPYVIAGRLTCEQQRAKGTADVCRSWHPWGHAVDLELHDPEDPSFTMQSRAPYEQLGEWWETLGGVWGGRWLDSYPEGLPGFQGAGAGDVVHYSYHPAGPLGAPPAYFCKALEGASLTECQRAVEAYDAARAMALRYQDETIGKALLRGGVVAGLSLGAIYLLR